MEEMTKLDDNLVSRDSSFYVSDISWALDFLLSSLPFQIRNALVTIYFVSVVMLNFVTFMKQLGLDARKPVFRGLQTQAQTSLRIRAV